MGRQSGRRILRNARAESLVGFGTSKPSESHANFQAFEWGKGTAKAGNLQI